MTKLLVIICVLVSYREQMRKFYYNPSKYDTYLEQLGIKYPTTR